MDDALTPSLRRLWEVHHDEPARRGRRPALSLLAVVTAGIELADDGGIAAVSMRTVAQRLGVTPMALYRHVAGKDELLTLMRDVALGLPPALDLADGGWRGALERWTRTMVTKLLERPWAIALPITGPPATPNSLAWLDYALQAMAELPLSETEKAGIALQLNGGAFWEARVSIEIVAAASASGHTPEQEMSRYSALLTEVVDPARFPALSRAMAARIFEDDADDFGFGRRLVLDGVESLLAARAA